MRQIKLMVITVIMLSLSIRSSFAQDSGQLNVSITEKGTRLEITETWNVNSANNQSFIRKLPLDENDIYNISIENIFPKSTFTEFKKEYIQRENSTEITINNNVKNGETFATKINYELELDNKTKNDFINSLPNSLFANNSPTTDNIKIQLNSEEIKTDTTTGEGQNNKTFVQETSKSQTVYVLISLLKIALGLALLIGLCIVVYGIVLYLYYKNASKAKTRNGNYKLQKKFKNVKKGKKHFKRTKSKSFYN